jgi:ABC-type Fe3+-hydroxamate transport system substrate-binding protein
MARSRKTAMVQGPPVRSVVELPIFADPFLQDKLVKTLRARKNNRAFIVVEYHNTWASVHFEGDAQPTMIEYLDK